MFELAPQELQLKFYPQNRYLRYYREFEKYNFEEIDKIIKVNLLGPMELTRLLLPIIKSNKGNYEKNINHNSFIFYLF